MRPWVERTAEIEERDGAWADYSAWREWMAKTLDVRLPDHARSVTDSLDGVQCAHLYMVMCELADGAGVAETTPAEARP